MSSGWDPAWNRFDKDGVILRMLDHGIDVVADSYKPWLAQLATKYEDGQLFKTLEDEKNFINFLMQQNILSCLNTLLPYPCHSDNDCQQHGIKTKSMITDPPTQVHLATATFQSNNSTLSTENTNVVGAKFDYKTNGEMILSPHPGTTLFGATNEHKASPFSILLLIVCLIFLTVIVSSVLLSSKAKSREVSATTKNFSETFV